MKPIIFIFAIVLVSSCSGCRTNMICYDDTGKIIFARLDTKGAADKLTEAIKKHLTQEK